MPAGFKAARDTFKALGVAHDVVSGKLTRQQALGQITNKFTQTRQDALTGALAANSRELKVRGLSGTDAESILEEAIQKVQSMHGSKVSKLARDFYALGKGGPTSGTFNQSSFYKGEFTQEYKRQLERTLIKNTGADSKQAAAFVEQLKINTIGITGKQGNQFANITNRISLGEKSTTGSESEFFEEILQRFRGIKNGKSFAEVAGTTTNGKSALQKSLEEVDDLFRSDEFRKKLDQKITSNWNLVASGNLGDAANDILKPAKANYLDYIGPIDSRKQEFLKRKTAQVLGIPLRQSDGKLVANGLIDQQLAARGYDPTNYRNMAGFLLDTKQMKTGLFSGGGNILGLKPLMVDEAFEKGFFKFMPEQQQQAIRQIAAAQAKGDPVSRTIGLSRVSGVYETRNGEILDFTKITSMLSNVGDFFATQFQIPLVKFNPAQLFGYNSYAQMREAPLIDYVGSRTVQPFLPKGAESKDFFIFHKTRNARGVLTGYSNTQFGRPSVEQLPGQFRPLATASMEMASEQARAASGLFGETTEQITGQSGYKFGILARNNEQRRAKLNDIAIRAKSRLDIASDQPSSLFGLGRRFIDRKTDINRPSIMARLIDDEQITIKQRGRERTLRLQGTQVVNEAGEEVFSRKQVLRALDRLRVDSLQKGYSPRVMETLEETAPQMFTTAGVRASQASSARQMIQNIQRILDEQVTTVASLRASGKYEQAAALMRTSSRLQPFLEESFYSSSMQTQAKTNVIASRLDQAKNEVFRYAAQKNQLLNPNQSDDIFTLTTRAISDLRKQGRISLDEALEAQAAAVGTLFNFSAFKTYSSSVPVGELPERMLGEVLGTLRGSEGARSLLSVYKTGGEAMIGTSIKRPLSRALPFLKTRFGTSPFDSGDLSLNVLGSGQQRTYVPTFGSAFAANPLAAIKSAAGFGTYTNQEAYSATFLPNMSHMVGRLNKYFGTFGLGLTTETGSYGGPVSLFSKGMVYKRVLPLVAGGTGLMAVDRTIGGFVNEKDENGERVYSPYFTTKAARGVVETQSVISGLMPGGMSYQEKKDQLLEGEVAIRQGRYWPLGNTPFQGGKVMYYRPSWYRRLQAGAMFTSESYGSPMERLAYGMDFSPLRPLDPYRFERKHYYDRPYPVTGEYFTGPFGPITPLLNMTVGKVLKPQRLMHEEALNQGLAQYERVGESGAYSVDAFNSGVGRGIPNFDRYYGGGGGASGGRYGQGGGYGVGAGSGGGPSYSSVTSIGSVGEYNRRLSSAAGPLGTAGMEVRSTIGGINNSLSENIYYGPPKVSGITPPGIVPAGQPIPSNRIGIQGGEFGYRMQEMAGIYGFGFGALREGLGFGQSDFEPQRAVLQSSAKAYGSTRSFWDLNLGGIGDFPTAGESAMGNIEISEIVRRFIPKERSGVDYINPIPNLMGQQYPFLPGAEYFTNFKTGDPFTRVQEGELRLPGVGYERLNRLYSDETGRYGQVSQLDILGDVAPYSSQFRKLNRSIKMGDLSPDERIKVQDIRAQVESTTQKYEFSPYKYKYGEQDPEIGGTIGVLDRAGEYIAHRDTYFNTKFLNKRTAVEDWERRNVYGSTFPEWQNPIQSFIAPMGFKASQRDPISATIVTATVGSLFGRSAPAKAFGTLAGGAFGLTSSLRGSLHEVATGDRYIPKDRRKELALEEYIDILTYTKNKGLAAQAQASGDSAAAASFESAAKRTMYGADIYGGSLETLSLAVPKRKREHFKAMINAPEEERDRILSTAGRLERRIYEAAWGMPVEEKPDLVEYFSRHELPSMSWEGWHPNTNMEHVKIKMGQSMGLEMSQMGYYPQQIQEANLVNPSYPSFFENNSRQDTAAQLRAMMSKMGVSGSVTPIRSPFGNESVNISAGIR